MGSVAAVWMSFVENGNVLLVAVPSFDVTHSCVVVNLRTLECAEMAFSTPLHCGANPEQLNLISQQSNEIVQDSHPPQDNEFNLFDQDESDDDMD